MSSEASTLPIKIPAVIAKHFVLWFAGQSLQTAARETPEVNTTTKQDLRVLSRVHDDLIATSAMATRFPDFGCFIYRHHTKSIQSYFSFSRKRKKNGPRAKYKTKYKNLDLVFKFASSSFVEIIWTPASLFCVSTGFQIY